MYRVSDAAMLSAAVLLRHLAGTDSLALLFGARGAPAAGLTVANATIIATLLIVAVAAKSALLPFSGWLPRAMEGPTPSSAVYYGSLFNLDASRYLIRRYAGETGLKPLLAEVPEQVEVTRRSKGGTDFYFLLNHGDSPVTVTVGDGFIDVLTGGAANTSLTLAPFDYRVLKRNRSAG